MIAPALWLWMVAAPPSLASDYIPCIPGLTVEFEFSARPGLRVEDSVRELRGNLCIVDRVTVEGDGRPEKEAYAREMLPDRVANAGFVGHLTAFRPPYLVEPIAPGTRWRFNGVEYTLVEVGITVDVKAGTFDDCLRVAERSSDGLHESSSVYARGVGLILALKAGQRMEARRVQRTDSARPHPSPSSKRPRGETTAKKRRTSGR